MLVPAILAVVVAACGTREPPLNQFDAVGLLERGMGAYHEGEWSDAIRYLDRFVLEYPTHARTEEARYYLADSYFQREEYIAAAGRFDRLATDFPQGEYVDDARFKVCASYHELSPEPTLDQEYTHAAMDHCRTLAIYHPESEYAARAEEILADLRNKLARKVLLSGEYYADRQAYDSAIIYFEAVLSQYADTDVAPQALLQMAEAYEEIGYTDDAQDTRERLQREYPESDEARSLRGPRAMGDGATMTSGAEAGAAAGRR